MPIPLRVLLVEDSADDARLILRLLNSGGFETEHVRVDTRASMGDALEKKSWDLVIADYSMPQFSSTAALALLKEKELDLPFIVVSGAIEEETAAVAMQAGAHDYVMKEALARLIPAVTRELKEAEIRRERKRSQKALKESEKRYRNLVMASPVPILIHHDEGIAFANPAALRTLGVQKENQLLGRSFGEFLCPREDSGTVPAGHTANACQLDYDPVEERFKRIDGTIINVEVMTTPVDYDGIPSWQVVFTDVTKRKQAEEDREVLEAQLSQAQKMEAIGHLAGGVAHDFNNLLSPILGYAEMLLLDFHEADPRHAKLQEVFKAANRAKNLTRQLLAFSRKQVLEVKTLNLNHVLADFASNILQRTIREDIEIQTRLASTLGNIKADASQIEQILMNLAVNAQDAMPGKGTMRIETSDVFLDEAFAQRQPGVKPGPYVLLSFSDTGTGMDEQTKSRIFEPFFTTKGVGKGTGLGLATVHGIVRQHGGYIEIDSLLDRGTTFKICLPRVEEAPSPFVTPSRQLPGIQGNETVLVVEDEDMVLNLCCSILQQRGYRTIPAACATEALKRVQEHDGVIHLLLTDVVMPDMNGRVLHEKVTALRPGIKTLFMSGYSHDVIANHGVLNEGVHFIQKPFSVKLLAKRVREVLDAPTPMRTSM